MGTRFVILAMARTGSGRLCEQLRAQPDIWCHHEVFHANKVKLRAPSEDGLRGRAQQRAFAALRERDREAFLEKVFGLSFGRAHVGFKVLSNQGGGEAFRLLDDPSLSKIVLLRTNVLAMYSSLLAAKQAGAWTSEKMAVTARPLVAFDEERFRALHEKHARFYGGLFDRLSGMGRHAHLIRYDELNVPSRIAMLLRHLGAGTDVVPLQEDKAVRGAPHIVSRFSNPDTVLSFLGARGLMHWAYEGDASFAPLP